MGGESGQPIEVEKGDVLFILAGIAHKNLGDRDQIKCVGAYPDGRDYDILTGKNNELSTAVREIKQVPLPDEDPLFGHRGGISRLWKPLKLKGPRK